MNIETNRLSTFANWPSTAPVDPIRIAKAGFFYTGEGTEVQCFSCGGKISEWNYGDQVMCRHRNLEPNCAFVLNPLGSGNVPLVLGREYPDQESSAAPPSESEQTDSTQENRDYGVTAEDEMYRSDALRLLSFVNWDDASVSRESLASVGFYRTSTGRLRCAWCGGELTNINNFGALGHPLQVHRTYFPRCSFAAGLEVAREATTVSRPASPISYIPPLMEPSCQPQSSGAVHNAQVLAANGTWRALGVVGGGSHHPILASTAARLETYHRWPTDRAQTPKTLADAGFFYTGADDQVRCFYCDGGLGRWEAADDPWAEHARWFPHCGFVLLVKGQQFVDASKPPAPAPAAVPRCLSAESGLTTRRRNTGVNFPVTEAQVTECMESDICMAALGAGLDAARVRRAIVRRLRSAGIPFSTSESLIDAVLDEQLNEEAWSVSPRSQRLARDILAETLRDFAPRAGLIPSSQEDSSDDRPSDSPPLSPTPPTPPNIPTIPSIQTTTTIDTPDQIPFCCNTESKPSGSNTPSNTQERDKSKTPEKKLTLEEENRQLKEARLCKVCMDSEVSVVFLPCGHLVSCGGCGAALSACPLCRCAVRALVRAYLA